MPASILIVDDESGIRESLSALLRDEGYGVEAAAERAANLGPVAVVYLETPANPL